MQDLLHQLFGLNMDFNKFKDIVVNIIWILGICGIGLEISPVKINPLKAVLKWIVSPFRAMVAEELLPVKNELKAHTGEIEKLNARLDKEHAEMEKRELSEKRWKILNFGDQLRSGGEATKETYDYMANLHAEYIQEIEESGATNGVMDATWAFIQERYEAHIRDNDFIG